MRQLLSILICVSLVVPGAACASAGRTPVATAPASVDTAAMADYVQRLPAGSRVRVERTDGTSVTGTLMKATDQAVVVQKSTRIPEPPVEVPLAQVARVTLHNGSSTGKAIAIGIASGVGVFFTIIAILAATFND